jgi:hypothetical protein
MVIDTTIFTVYIIVFPQKLQNPYIIGSNVAIIKEIERIGKVLEYFWSFIEIFSVN